MNEKPVRKPRNVKIDPEALHKARVEALRARKTLGEWLEEAIDEKIEREQKKVK
jgi:predicted HicB family RNase H-like nuclease